MYHLTYGNPVIQTPFGSRHIINADTTASGYPNQVVEHFINNQILPYYNNTHSNAYCGRLMSHYVNQAKTIIRKCLNADDQDKLIFTGNGCSGAITHLIHALNLHHTCPEDTVVIISKAEHHSNHLPWTHLPVTLLHVPLDKQGLIDIHDLEAKLVANKGKKIIVSMIAASNVTGVIQPTGPISQLVHRYGGLVFWDYAASAPYVAINVNRDPKSGDYYDAVFISTHKFFGGPGTPGILLARASLFINQVPFCPAGGTVRFVCSKFQKYSGDVETKETGGTPNILGCIKAGLVFDFKARHQAYIHQRDDELVQYVQPRLLKIPNIKVLNPIDNLHRLPIFVFTVADMHYNLVVVLLNDLFGIQSRGGVSCCSMLAQDMLHIDQKKQKEIYNTIIQDRGVPADYGWCRVSFNYVMTQEIIDYIIKSIEYVALHGKKYIPMYRYIPEKNNWIYHKAGLDWNDFEELELNTDAPLKTYKPVYLD